MQRDPTATFPVGQWRKEYQAASVAMDLRRSRALVQEAADAGMSLSAVYVHLVRPTLVAARRDTPGRFERLVVDSASAALAGVGARPVDGATMRGAGRDALVSVGAGPLDVLDGQVIVDALRADGWTVDETDVDCPAEQVAELARGRAVQLVVMPTSNPADLLLAAAAYTLLRRLPDPPVIVACSFGQTRDTVRARAAGADAFVADPEQLLRFVGQRLPADGLRNWGVQLRRLRDVLVVIPTGDFDEASLLKLRQVVGSRAGSFNAFVIDTRNVAGVRGCAADSLVQWLREEGTGRFIAGPGFDAAPAEPALLATAADVE